MISRLIAAVVKNDRCRFHIGKRVAIPVSAQVRGTLTGPASRLHCSIGVGRHRIVKIQVNVFSPTLGLLEVHRKAAIWLRRGPELIRIGTKPVACSCVIPAVVAAIEVGGLVTAVVEYQVARCNALESKLKPATAHIGHLHTGPARCRYGVCGLSIPVIHVHSITPVVWLFHPNGKAAAGNRVVLNKRAVAVCRKG